VCKITENNESLKPLKIVEIWNRQK